MSLLVNAIAVILLLIAQGAHAGLAATARDGGVSPAGRTARMPVITVLYDDTAQGQGVEAAWGLSLLVQRGEDSVLFDAGGVGETLLSNMRKLGLAPRDIDAVVISHLHGDHAGGLPRFISENRRAVCYLPDALPKVLARKLERQGVQIVAVAGPAEILPGIFCTGVLGTAPREQALVVRTPRGLIVVTGCAHPGVERVVREARRRFGAEVILLMGGFHLTGRSPLEIDAVVAGLKKQGVQHVAPCHCTGAVALGRFKEAFGSGFIAVSVGTVIDVQGLK